MAKTQREAAQVVHNRREHRALHLDEDEASYRRERLLRRVGIAGLSAFLLAAALGVFGSGPLSKGEARSRDGSLVAKYERFARVQASTTLHFALRHVVSSEPLRLRINGAFAERVQIEQILPLPSSMFTAGAYYLVVVEHMNRDSANIVIRYRPETLGSQLLAARVGSSEVRFRQFVYP